MRMSINFLAWSKAMRFRVEPLVAGWYPTESLFGLIKKLFFSAVFLSDFIQIWSQMMPNKIIPQGFDPKYDPPWWWLVKSPAFPEIVPSPATLSGTAATFSTCRWFHRSSKWDAQNVLICYGSNFVLCEFIIITNLNMFGMQNTSQD